MSDIRDDDLVVVETHINNFSAEIALGALEAGGIDAIVSRDDCGGMRPHLWLGGIRLLVRREDRSRAEKILSEGVDESAGQGEANLG